MRNILRLRVLGILLLALGLFGGTAASAYAADATPPADSDTASVTIAAFWSDQVAKPTLTEGAASATEDEGVGAGFIEATFSIYINGDLTADPWATVTTWNGDAQVIDALPVGTHKLVLDGAVGYESPYTWSWDITVTAGTGTFLTVLVPWGDEPGNSSTGSLVLSSFGADQVDSPQFLVSPPINITPDAADDIEAAGDYDLPYEGAYTVDREFLIYLNGDTNSVPIALQTIGGTDLEDGLPAGTHLLVDAQSEYSIDFEIAQGSITTIVAVFPEGFGDTGNTDDPDTEEPGNGTGDDDGSDDGSDDGDVTKLPNTGQTGSESDSSTLVIVLGAMSLLALAGGYAWRQRRTA